MTERLYSGLTADERAARRRDQLLEAGLEIFAEVGWAASTVQDVCDVAGLSPRYFYAHFSGRAELFAAVVALVAEQAEAVALGALSPSDDPRERAHAVLAALVGWFTSDPRRIRVALMESLATDLFREQRRLLLVSFSDLGARLMRPLGGGAVSGRGSRGRLRLTAGLLTGSLVEALIAWAGDPTEVAAGALVDHLTQVYVATARL